MTDNNLPQKLEWRLRSIANGAYKSNGDEFGQCALMYLELFVTDGQIIGWLKPEVKPLEPRGINPLSLNPDCVDDWTMAIRELFTKGKGTLLLQRGEPVGWLR